MGTERKCRDVGGAGEWEEEMKGVKGVGRGGQGRKKKETDSLSF